MQYQTSLFSMRMRTLGLAVVLTGICICEPRQLSAQEFPLARYGIVDELVLADTGEVKPRNRPRIDGTDLRDQNGAVSFILVFVVDTLGKVEMSSVSFGNDVPQPFMRYTCRLLEAMEYSPLRRDGQPKRALVVDNWGIQRGGTEGAGRISANPLRQAFRESGIVEVLAIVAKQPHCVD